MIGYDRLWEFRKLPPLWCKDLAQLQRSRDTKKPYASVRWTCGLTHYFQDHTMSIDVYNLNTCSHDRACSKWVDVQLILVLDAWTYITSSELTYINLLEFSFCAMYRSPRLFWLLALAVCFSMRRKIWKLVVWCGSLGCCKELEVAFVRGKFCLFRGALLNLNRVPKSLVLLCFEATQPLAPFWSGMSWTTELDVWCVYKHRFVWPHVCGEHGKDQGQHDRQVTDVTDQQFLFLFHWCCICNLNIDSQVDWLEANGYEVASKQGRGGPDKCLFVLIYACP